MNPKLSSIIAMIIAVLFIVIASHVYGSPKLGIAPQQKLEQEQLLKTEKDPTIKKHPNWPFFDYSIPITNKDVDFLQRIVSELQIRPCGEVNNDDLQEGYLFVSMCYYGNPEIFVGVLIYKPPIPYSLYLLSKDNVFILVWGLPCPPMEKVIEKQGWENGPRRTKT